MEHIIPEDMNALLKRRMEELEELNSKNVNCFAYNYPTNSHSEDILSNFIEDGRRPVSIAGRIIALRRMGKATFAHLQDSRGKIQIYLKRDELPDSYDHFRLLDIGDIIGVTGFVFKTKTGEISVHVEEFTLLTKSLRPIPTPKEVVNEHGEKVVFDQFVDKELRYRQRYVDLIVNPEVKKVFFLRSRVISAMRQFLDEKGVLEVETPVLQPMYGGASARPFVTHHNALNIPFYLRIADELYLKRLLVGGFEGVYEISKDFRNEGMDKTHNPEFTMMEVYVAYKDYFWMMEFVEEMFAFICKKVFNTLTFEFDGHTIDFTPPWNRVSMIDAIETETGKNVMKLTDEEIVSLAKSAGVEITGKQSRGKLIDEIFEMKVQSKLIQPTFLMEYPVETSPLAKKHREKAGIVERFEGFVAGRELCNAFSELNDPVEQANRFLEQKKALEMGDEEAQQIDEDFIRALEFGMPPAAGLGIGIDRLIMLLTGQVSIRDVIFFPQMKPEIK